jgi:hypothetical protein
LSLHDEILLILLPSRVLLDRHEAGATRMIGYKFQGPTSRRSQGVEIDDWQNTWDEAQAGLIRNNQSEMPLRLKF